MNKNRKKQNLLERRHMSRPMDRKKTNKTETPSKKKQIINSSAEQVILCFWSCKNCAFAIQILSLCRSIFFRMNQIDFSKAAEKLPKTSGSKNSAKSSQNFESECASDLLLWFWLFCLTHDNAFEFYRNNISLLFGKIIAEFLVNFLAFGHQFYRLFFMYFLITNQSKDFLQIAWHYFHFTFGI